MDDKFKAYARRTVEKGFEQVTGDPAILVGQHSLKDPRAPKKKKKVEEGKIADKLRQVVADMKAADRKAGLLPGGPDVVDLDVERERRRKKKVKESNEPTPSDYAPTSSNKLKKPKPIKPIEKSLVVKRGVKKEESNWRSDFYQESATNPKKFDMEKFKQGLRDREGAVFYGDPGTEPKKQPKRKPKPDTRTDAQKKADQHTANMDAVYGGKQRDRGLGT